MDGHPMRKINGKLFLALLLGGTAVVGIAFAVHYFQFRRIATALLWQARQAEEQGQTARSAEYLQRYLEFEPRDLDEKARLARLWSNANPRARFNAVNLLDEVLVYQDDADLRRLLVKTALEVADFRRAREHIEKLMPWDGLRDDIEQIRANSKQGKPLPVALERVDRARGELEMFWGQLQEQDKKPAEAIGCYRLSVLHAPDAPDGAVRLAFLLRRTLERDANQRKKNFADADKVMDDMVQRNADDCSAYLARWRYRRDFNIMAIREAGPLGTDIPLETAARDLSEAIKRRPDSPEVILATADLERLRGRSAAEAFERPIAERQKQMAEHRTKALDHLDRGLVLVRQAKGIDSLEFQFLWHKGNLLLDDLDLMRMTRRVGADSGSADEAKRGEIAAVIEQVRKTNKPAAADYMKGRLHVNKLEWGPAALLFERARTQMSGDRNLASQANLYLGQCYERLEEHAQMYNAFKRVTDEDPTAVPAILGKAAARWAQGQLKEALTYYHVALLQKAVPPRAWLDIARLEIQIQTSNTKPNWGGAENALKGAAALLEPENLELVLLRAELALRKDDLKGAREILTAARAKVPTEPEFLTALVDIALRQKNQRRAEELLKEVKAGETKLPDSVALRLSYARVFSASQDKDKVAKLQTLAEARDRFTPEDQARLLSGLADSLFRTDAHKEARAMWLALAELPQHRTDLRLRMLLFDLAMKDADRAGMQQTLDDISKIEPANGAYHRYGESLLLIWQARNEPSKDAPDQLAKARRNLDAVLASRPNWPAVFVARAEIAEANGAPEQAIKELEEARKHGDNSPSVLRKLATLLTQAGREGEAQVMLGTLDRPLLFNTDLGRLAVTVALRRGEMRQAVDLMRVAVRENTRDPKQIIWMAQVMAAAGKARDAESHLRHAIELQPNEPDGWVTLVQLLITQKRGDEATKEMAKMERKVPENRLPMARARCQDYFGKAGEAVDAYAKALEAGKDDPLVVKAVAVGHMNANRSALAEPLLRRLARTEIRGTAPADIDWAKRNLALLLAGGTSSTRFAEALGLVGLSLDEKGNLPKDLPATTSTELKRTRARVLASQNQAQFRDRAIGLLDELSKARATSADDEFVLALLYDAAGQSAKSRALLKKLAEPQTRTPRYLAQYAMALLTDKTPTSLQEAGKVVGWIEEIEKQTKSEPNRFASVELRARRLEALGKGDEAVALLEKHTSREKAKPEEMVLVVDSLTRQKRFEDAFRLCVKAWEAGKVMPEALGAMSVGLLGLMNPTDIQVEAIQTKLLEAIKAKPEVAVLRLHLAQLYDRRGKYDKSAEEYRKALKVEPNNVVALNNLAWLLAQTNEQNVKAMEYIDKAIAGMGRRPELLDTRGMVHLAAKDNAKALADIEEALAAAPTAARLYYQARILHDQGKKTRAREVLTEARQKGLKASTLHPIEQAACRKLLEEYGYR